MTDLHLSLNQSTNKLVPFQDRDGNPVDVQVKDNGNGTYTCSYTPRKPLKHTVMVSWGGVNIPESPFRVGSNSVMVKILRITVLALYLKTLCIMNTFIIHSHIMYFHNIICILIFADSLVLFVLF